MAANFDIHQQITDQIIAMLDRPQGAYEQPWLSSGKHWRPTNAITGKAYQGINILALWAASERAGYRSGLWGTYRQWASIGAQVRKGEQAACVFFYKQSDVGGGSARREDKCNASKDRSQGRHDADESVAHRLIIRTSGVFAPEQVDGFDLPESVPTNPMEVNARAETFVAKTKATIIYQGDRAFYRPSTDTIQMPPRSAFIGSKSSSALETYYSNLFHELTHWSGHADRCARDLGLRFGPEAYAMEELIAELGAAFLSAELGITPTPRADHAQYLGHWLKVLRNDKRAIFSAASLASKAVSFMRRLQPPVLEGQDETVFMPEADSISANLPSKVGPQGPMM